MNERPARGRGVGRWRVWAGGLLVLLVIGVAGAGSALVVSEPIDSPDAIVSLASHEWDRLPVAAQLARTFGTAKVVLTEPPEVSLYNCHDCARRVDHLRALGVDEGRVRVLKLKSDGTHGEALAVLEFVRAARVSRLLIVTSPYHTRRALALFRNVLAESGVTIGIVPADVNTQSTPATWWWHADDRTYVPYEWAAIVYYALRYGVWPL